MRTSRLTVTDELVDDRETDSDQIEKHLRCLPGERKSKRNLEEFF